MSDEDVQRAIRVAAQHGRRLVEPEALKPHEAIDLAAQLLDRAAGQGDERAVERITSLARMALAALNRADGGGSARVAALIRSIAPLAFTFAAGAEGRHGGHGDPNEPTDGEAEMRDRTEQGAGRGPK